MDFFIGLTSFKLGSRGCGFWSYLLYLLNPEDHPDLTEKLLTGT